MSATPMWTWTKAEWTAYRARLALMSLDQLAREQERSNAEAARYDRLRREGQL